MDVSKLKAAIFSKRQEIRQAIRNSLKAKGLSADNILNVITEDECSKAIKKHDNLIVVLDWDNGPNAVGVMLETIATTMRTGSHPTFLIASKSNDNILKLGAEYKVAKIAIGEINSDTINEQVTSLVASMTNIEGYEQTMQRVKELLEQSNVYGAMSHLEAAHEAAVTMELYGVELAELYFQNNKQDAAEHLLKDMMNEFPSNARVKHIYARCKLHTKDYEGAIASLKGAQLISPANVQRLLEMGGAYLEIDRPDQANSVFEEILRLAPELKQAKKGQAQSQLMSGEINEGLNLIRSSLNPREIAAVFNTAAIIAIRNGKYSEGLSLYKIAAKTLEGDEELAAKIVYNMGIGFVKWGKVHQSVACFEKAVSLNSGFDNARHNAEIVRSLEGQDPKKLDVDLDTIIASEEEEDMEAFSVASVFDDL
jgi:tetratricopeptide (TPR) repeat protein